MNLKIFLVYPIVIFHRNVTNCDDNVVQDLYMLLPTDKRTLVLAGIPELFLCVCLLLCASLKLLRILSKSLFLKFLLTSLVIQHYLALAAVATSTLSIVKDQRQLIC